MKHAKWQQKQRKEITSNIRMTAAEVEAEAHLAEARA